MNVVLLIMLCASLFASQSESSDKTIIDKFIAKQAAQESGSEYEEARKVIGGDLNSDGTPDLAVLYTIEGQNATNNYVQYLAVFVRAKGQLLPVTHTGVGGKNFRAVELQSIGKGVILLETLEYAAQDGACCPSKKGKAQYVLVNRRLKQLKGLRR